MVQLTRRELLASGLALTQSSMAAAAARRLRCGFIGVGNRGTALLEATLALGNVDVPAICDINEASLRRAQEIVEKSHGQRPEGYGSRGPEDFRRLVARDDLDAVVNAGPWEWHTPMSVATMRAGKYAATEVPAATTLEECWQLVDTSEATGMACMMLENVCYFRNVLAVLQMVRAGLLGTLTHCEGGYQHDLRKSLVGTSGLSWRGVEMTKFNGNLYPTHPIGPIAWWLNINRGDRFTKLVSMSSAPQSLNEFARREYGAEPRRFTQGDVNTSLIRTENGPTVTLYFDTASPRPYDLILRAQGTRGIYAGGTGKIYVDGRSPKQDEWEDAAPYAREYDHPMWKKLEGEAAKHGHGGADYVQMVQFFRAVRMRTPTPIDVYDTATWSAVVPLSIQSVASGSNSVEFPDFTRGKWKWRGPVDPGGVD